MGSGSTPNYKRRTDIGVGTMVDHCSSWQVGGDYGGPLFLMAGGWGLWGTTVPHGKWVGTMVDHCSSWQVGGDYGGPLFLMAGGWGLWWTTVHHGRCGL